MVSNQCIVCKLIDTKLMNCFCICEALDCLKICPIRDNAVVEVEPK